MHWYRKENVKFQFYVTFACSITFFHGPFYFSFKYQLSLESAWLKEVHWHKNCFSSRKSRIQDSQGSFQINRNSLNNIFMDSSWRLCVSSVTHMKCTERKLVFPFFLSSCYSFLLANVIISNWSSFFRVCCCPKDLYMQEEKCYGNKLLALVSDPSAVSYLIFCIWISFNFLRTYF